MNRGLLEKLAWTEPDRDVAGIASLTASLAGEDGRADDGNGWPQALWGLTGPSWRAAMVASGRVWRRSACSAAIDPAICPARRRKSHGGFHPFAA